MTIAEIQSLPKAELHCHLELCFRQKTLAEIGPQLGIAVPIDAEQFRREWLIAEPLSDLASVLARFLRIQKFWSSEELIERLTFEAVEDAAAKNIRLLELRYAPTFIAEKNPHLSFDKIHRSILRGIARAKDLPIAVGVIGIIQRILPLAQAEEVSEFIVANKDSFVGMDLADNEIGFDCRTFSPFFRKAKEQGLHITVHSGEADVPEAPRFVRDAIDELGAERIGHGLQIIKDPETVKYVAAKGVILEICPTSNWLTNAVPSLAAHPIKKLMTAGVLCTINTDDPSMFGIDINHEHMVLAEHLGMTMEDFKSCQRIAADRSFIPLEKKKKVWPGL